MDVTGKVVLITGAARGIGAEVARQLAARGARLALVGLEKDQLERVAEHTGGKAWEADVTDWETLERVTKEVVEHFGGIDVVVANAGVASAGFVRSMDIRAFERVIEVNLLGVWRTVRTTLPHLIEARGYVLVVSSLAAFAHLPGMAPYAAAKAGCEAFANCLRTEVEHLGVDVGVAYFSWISTDLVNSADQHPVFGPSRKAIRGPLGRTYPVDQVGRAVVKGITKRTSAVHVPGWVGAAKLIRAFIPKLVERESRRTVAEADRAMAERDLSGLIGPGGLAAEK